MFRARGRIVAVAHCAMRAVDRFKSPDAQRVCETALLAWSCGILSQQSRRATSIGDGEAWYCGFNRNVIRFVYNEVTVQTKKTSTAEKLKALIPTHTAVRWFRSHLGDWATWCDVSLFHIEHCLLAISNTLTAHTKILRVRGEAATCHKATPEPPTLQLDDTQTRRAPSLTAIIHSL